MNDPYWRGKEELELPYRKFIRQHCPSGSFRTLGSFEKSGFVAEDLDLVMRQYGPHYNTDQTGRFRIVEIKCARGSVGWSKEMTFGLMDSLMRRGDEAPPNNRYLGWWLVYTEHDDWFAVDRFVVRRLSDRTDTLHYLDQAEFIRWLNFELNLDAYPKRHAS